MADQGVSPSEQKKPGAEGEQLNAPQLAPALPPPQFALPKLPSLPPAPPKPGAFRESPANPLGQAAFPGPPAFQASKPGLQAPPGPLPNLVGPQAASGPPGLPIGVPSSQASAAPTGFKAGAPSSQVSAGPTGLPIGMPSPQFAGPPGPQTGMPSSQPPPFNRPDFSQQAPEAPKFPLREGPPKFSFQPSQPPPSSPGKFGPQIGLQPSGEIPKPTFSPATSPPYPFSVATPSNIPGGSQASNFSAQQRGTSEVAPKPAEEQKATPVFTPPVYQFNLASAPPKPGQALPSQSARPTSEPRLFRLLRESICLKNDEEIWVCPKCTLEDSLEFVQCEACGYVNEPLKGVLAALKIPGKMRQKTIFEAGGDKVKNLIGRLF